MRPSRRRWRRRGPRLRGGRGRGAAPGGAGANATKQIEVLVRTSRPTPTKRSCRWSAPRRRRRRALLARTRAPRSRKSSRCRTRSQAWCRTSPQRAWQATSSQSISRNMQVLRRSVRRRPKHDGDVHVDRQAGELAAQLRKSVAGFRLPDDQGASVSGEYRSCVPRRRGRRRGRAVAPRRRHRGLTAQRAWLP